MAATLSPCCNRDGLISGVMMLIHCLQFTDTVPIKQRFYLVSGLQRVIGHALRHRFLSRLSLFVFKRVGEFIKLYFRQAE